MRTLKEISRDIPAMSRQEADWAAWAMGNINSVSDWFGYHTGAQIVSIFLTHAYCWQGSKASRIKKELDAHLSTVTWALLDTTKIDDEQFKKAVISFYHDGNQPYYLSGETHV